jgi:phage/plasmid primase-like uncharacterized protein
LWHHLHGEEEGNHKARELLARRSQSEKVLEVTGLDQGPAAPAESVGKQPRPKPVQKTKCTILDEEAVKSAFESAMLTRGLIIPKGGVDADGKVHRCSVDNEKSGKGDGAYILHLDGIPAGGFQNHRDGLGWQDWKHETPTRTFTEAEKKAYTEKIAKMQRERDAEKGKLNANAAARAAAIVKGATAAPEDHPYLVSKQIAPHGVLYSKGAVEISPWRKSKADVLIVPLRDIHGTLWNVQLIDGEGEKDFLYGGRKKGCFFVIKKEGMAFDAAGINPNGHNLIGEGLATMATCFKAVDCPAVVACDAGNLEHVAKALRVRYAKAPFVLCRDDDWKTKDVHGNLTNPGKNYGEKAAQAIVASIAAPVFSGERQDKWTDFNDLYTAEGLEAVAACIDAASAPGKEQKQKKAPGDDKTQVQKLLDLVEDIEFFHDTEPEPYARICEGERRLVASIDTKTFKRVLRHRVYRQYGCGINDETMRAAVQTLEARALFDGPQYDVHLRTARHGGNLYINLARDDGSAVEITPDGWSVVTEAPVRFVRPPAMRALPIPQRGGSIAALVRLLNVATWRDFVLSVSWLLGALNSGECPYPIAAFTGEQGTAKSSSTRNLRRLIDPNRALLRSLPREERDLAVTAKGSHILTFDNLSGLAAWTSDALCKLATGGGFSCRELYSNDGEFIFDGRRPIIMNGIEDFATRGDLADRCIFLRLNPIPEEQRRTEAELDLIFEHEAPKLLGVLLNAASYGLANPLTLPIRPRMADFAEWIASCEGYFHGTELPFLRDNGAAFVWRNGDFMKAYDCNRKEATEIVLDADAVGVALLAFMDNRSSWTGTATDLRAELSALVAEDVRRDREWPQNARSVSSRLTRLAPALRRSLIEITKHKEARGKRVITITHIGPDGDHPTPIKRVNFAPLAPPPENAAENSIHFSDLRACANSNGVAPRNGFCASNGHLAPHMTEGGGAKLAEENAHTSLRPVCAASEAIENTDKINGCGAKAQKAQIFHSSTAGGHGSGAGENDAAGRVTI